MIDYEQLYYDELYKNKKLENKIKELRVEIEELNNCKTKKNINLQQYLLNQLKRYRSK